MSITVAFHTGRRNPRFDWFFDSLKYQKGLQRVTQIIIVDFYLDGTASDTANRRGEIIEAAGPAFTKILDMAPPKPTFWQGRHRVTKENHWAMSNARNTSICLCKNDWIVLLDDRAVLRQGYIQCVRRAMGYRYAVFGSYQKRHGMAVERGVITKEGDITGVDNREAIAGGKIMKVDGAWGYGCSLALPIEWALQVNGFPETADGLSFEDILFARILENNKYEMRYDPNMRVVQDRTPSELDKPFRREDKGVSPNDKSHASLEVIGGKRRSEHEWDLRQIRKDVLAGKPFPIPTNPDPRDWYDQTPIRDL